jgi:hypothetical protein
MRSETCPNCSADRRAEVKQSNATGGAIIGALLLSMLIGFVVAGVNGILFGAGFGLFIAFVAVTLYVFALKPE